jgi:anti-anti-sigma factor
MPDLDFDLTVAPNPQGGRRIALRGELDLGTAGQLQAALAAETGGPLVLDLTGLTFMDSTGVRVLLEAAERTDGLSIVPPADGDARVTIEETGIGALLPLAADPEGPR